MKNIIYTIVRILLGVAMVASGTLMLVSGGFPTEYENEIATLYMDAMEKVGYFVPLLAIVKIISGLSFITKRYMPLTLIIFMSLSVNMVAFHLFLEPFTGFPAYFIFIMNLYLIIRHLPDYKNLLKARS